MNSIKYHIYFSLILVLNLGVLLFIISGLSISYKEALLYLEDSSLISHLANLSTSYFGSNDYGVRVPNLIIHALNLIFIYLISNKILKNMRDSIVCVLVYTLIPGVILQGVLVNESGLMLFVVLLICYIEIAFKKIAYPLLFLAIFIHQSAFILFFALFFYALYRKWSACAVFALVCFAANMYIFGIDIYGKPSGNFLNVIEELALLYSPPLFVYYVYTLYRNATKSKTNNNQKDTNKNLLLFVSIASLLISVILSVRQGVEKEIFLFMSLCGIPLMIRQFLSDIRIRLPRFQNAYKNRFIIVLVFLVFEAMLLIFSKSLYLVVDNPSKSFLNSFYIAKEVSEGLKERNISRVMIKDSIMQKRLEFYGIAKGGQPLRKVSKNGNIIVKYYGRIVARYAI